MFAMNYNQDSKSRLNSNLFVVPLIQFGIWLGVIVLLLIIWLSEALVQLLNNSIRTVWSSGWIDGLAVEKRSVQLVSICGCDIMLIMASASFPIGSFRTLSTSNLFNQLHVSFIFSLFIFIPALVCQQWTLSLFYWEIEKTNNVYPNLYMLTMCLSTSHAVDNENHDSSRICHFIKIIWAVGTKIDLF